MTRYPLEAPCPLRWLLVSWSLMIDSSPSATIPGVVPGAEISPTELGLMRSLGRSAEAEEHRSGLGAVWTWVSHPDQGPLMRLFFEAYGLALRHPDRYADFIDHAIRDWLDEPLAAIDDVSATLAIATVTGLVLDLLTTGDRPRVEEAMERFLLILRAHADVSATVSQQKTEAPDVGDSKPIRSGEDASRTQPRELS
jgi:hypothetical protein